MASPIACRTASTTRGSARPCGGVRLAALRSAIAARPPASYRCLRCLTALAVTGRPAAVSSAAFARSRRVSDTSPGSYSGRGTAPGGASGGRPRSTSTMCRSHHSASATAASGSPSSGLADGSGTPGRLTGRPPRPGPRLTAPAARCPGQPSAPAARAGGTAPGGPPGSLRPQPAPASSGAGGANARRRAPAVPGRPAQRAMPVTRQPPHVRREHRIDRPHPAELPASRLAGPGRDLERLRVPRLDPVIGADIDHHAGPVGQPGEEIRSMTPAPPAVMPVQPERLRRHRRHRRVEVQQHQVIPLQPRLVTDMPPGRGQPPPAREMTLPARPAERADGNGILEPLVQAPAQRNAAAAVRIPENQLNAKALSLGLHSSSQLHQPRLKVRCPPGTTGQTLVRQKAATDKDR